MKEFPPRIFALIKTASEKGWEDGDGITYVDDADAAIAWIEAAQADRQFSDADQRDLNIGRAIQRAAMELPETCSINIELSLGSGSVVWFDEDDHGECSESGEPFSVQIHAAIDASIASISPK